MFSLLQLQYPVFTLPPGYDLYDYIIAFCYHVLALLFVFLPFFCVIKKWKPATWWKMAGAVVGTFLLHIFMMFVVADTLYGWIDSYIENGQYLSSLIGGPQFMFSFLVALLLIFSPFWSVWLIYHKYTWLRFFAATLLAIILVAVFLVFYYWLLMQGIRGIYEHLN